MLAGRVRGWWGDILECLKEDDGVWFEEFLKRRVGNGATASFWHDAWIGDEILRSKFARLYELCTEKECSVENAGTWTGNQWSWGFGWRREFWAKYISSKPDEWCWELEPSGSYSVRSSYNAIMKKKRATDGRGTHIFKLIWDNCSVPKVKITTWRIITRKIATKLELRRRGSLPHNASTLCPLCSDDEETINHLFIECSRSWELWIGYLDWIGLNVILPNNVYENFYQFCNLATGYKKRRVLAAMWECTVWLIWKKRNEIVFNNGVWKLEKLLGDIESFVWCWEKAARASEEESMIFGHGV